MKTDNILVTQTGQIKVADFGFAVRIPRKILPNHAAVFSEKYYQNKTVCGTPCYMAPEVLGSDGTYDAFQADAWSL